MGTFVTFTSAAVLLVCTIFTALGQSPAMVDRRAEAERLFTEGRGLYTAAYGNSVSMTRPFAETKRIVKQAAARFEEARVLFSQLGDRRSEASCYEWLGHLLGSTSDAVKKFELALAIYVELKDSLQIATVKGRIALVLSQTMETPKAVELYLEAANIAREEQNPEMEARYLSAAGQGYASLGQFPKAVELYKRSLDILRAAGKPVDLFTLNLLAGTYKTMGERYKALETYEQMRVEGRSGRGTIYEALALNNIAGLYSSLGEDAAALEGYAKALEIYRSAKWRTSEPDILRNIALVYSDLEDPKLAIANLQEALKIEIELGNKRGEAESYEALATVYHYDFADREKANEFYRKALSIFTDRSPERARVLGKMADLQPSTAEGRAKARQLGQEALGIYRQVGDREKQAVTYLTIGKLEAFDGSWRAANNNFVLSFTLFRLAGVRQGEADVLEWLRHVAAMTGNPAMSILYGKLAINKYQELRADIRGFDKETQKNYLKGADYTFRQVAGSLLDAGRVKEAVQIVTFLKDQQFYDLESSSSALKKVTFNERERDFAKRFGAEADSFSDAYLKLVNDQTEELKRGARPPTKEESDKSSRVSEALKNAGTRFESFMQEAAAEFLKPFEPDNVYVAEVAQLQSVLRTISRPNHETVAVYQIGTDRTWYSLIVGPAIVKSIGYKVDLDKLDRKALEYWRLLQSDRYDPSGVGKELFDIVFKPLEKHLPPAAETIMWSLDGNLRYVPMAALFDGRKYLVERFNNVNFTRADAKQLTSEVSSEWSAAAFGTTRSHTINTFDRQMRFASLPGVSDELSTLFSSSEGRKLLGGKALLDQDFTRSAMFASLKARRPVVHIASHFSFRPGDDTRSFLLMGDGTPFTLADMKTQKDLFAGVELLTLSACNTAAQQSDANGREVDAFFELAQRLGARSVLATLWPVADASTPLLMREFYSGKIKKKLSKAESLRRAQLALLRGEFKSAISNRSLGTAAGPIIVTKGVEDLGPKKRADDFVTDASKPKNFKKDPARPYSHPFYWSPFVLFGNWR